MSYETFPCVHGNAVPDPDADKLSLYLDYYSKKLVTKDPNGVVETLGAQGPKGDCWCRKALKAFRGPIGPKDQLDLEPTRPGRASRILALLGPQGDPGETGPAGPQDPAGASTSRFFYRVDLSSTGASDPGTGDFGYNNVVQASATALYFDNLTQEGFDSTLMFTLSQFNDEIVIQDKNLSVNHQVWRMTGPGQQMPDWFQVPVEFVSINGAPFTGTQEVAVLLRSVGEQGPEGPKGDPGDVGAEGPQGATGPAGATGVAGPQGDVGPTGPEGPEGPQGATGTTGSQGPKGDTGDTGPAGTTGATGSTGPAGPAPSGPDS